MAGDTGNNSSTTPTTAPPQIAPPSSSGVTFFNGGSAGGTPTVGQQGNPLLSQDQSAFTQYVLQQTGGYPVTVGNLPGVSGTTGTTIGQVLQDFMDLPPNQLQQIEMMLWDAGYYVNGDGSPVNAQDIRFGVPGDPASWSALARGLAAASTSGQTLYGLLTSRAQQGASVNNRLPGAALGGGNTYTIDLSNPDTVRYLSDQIFESTLGRRATASEVGNITSALRSQEVQQGLAHEAGQELSSRQRYQAQVTQRNIAYESETNPNIGGPIPQGPFNTPTEWAAAELAYMNMPVTTSNVAGLAALAAKMGPFNDGSRNPLRTQRPEGGSTAGPGGVQQFQNWAQGLEATASMLMNGKYQRLVGAMQAGTLSAALKSDKGVGQDVAVWSGGQFSSVTVDSSTTTAAAGSVRAYQAQQSVPSAVPRGRMTGSQITQLQTPQTAGPVATQGVNPNDVNLGQQPPNPGDQYINPVTTYTVNPASETAAAYQEATTGANAVPYLGNQYLGAYQAILSMIKAGGPTG